MKKTFLLGILCGFAAMYSCTSEPNEFSEGPDSQTRATEYEFYNLFEHSSAQNMPIDAQQDNAFRTVFASVAAHYLIQEQHGVWDSYAPIIKAWNVSDELYFASGGARSAFLINPDEDPADLSSRAISTQWNYGEAYHQMVQSIYEENINYFHDLLEEDKYYEVRRFLRNKGISFNDSQAMGFISEIDVLIDSALENKDEAIPVRPFPEAFSMEDGIQYLIPKKPGERRLLGAMQRSLEAFMGIDNHTERIIYIDNLITELNSMDYTNLVDENKLTRLMQSLSVGAYAATFWKVHYGMEVEGSAPAAELTVDLINGNLEIGGQESTISFKVIANGDWTVSCTSHEDIVAMTPIGGRAGEHTVAVTVAENTGDETRNISLEFVCIYGDERVAKIVTIVQDHTPSPEISVELIDGQTTISGRETTLLFKVVADNPWSFACISHLTAATASPSFSMTAGEKLVTVKIKENLSVNKQPRNIVMIFEANDGIKYTIDTITVVQAYLEEPGLDVQLTRRVIGQSYGSSTQGKVVCEGDWMAEPSNDAVTVYPSSGTGNTDIIISSNANNTGLARSVRINFTAANGSKTEEMYQIIYQPHYAAPEFSLLELWTPEDSKIFPKAGGSKSYSIHGNCVWYSSELGYAQAGQSAPADNEYKPADPFTHLTSSPQLGILTPGNGGIISMSSVRVVCAPNTGSAPRQESIYFYCYDRNLQRVYQTSKTYTQLGDPNPQFGTNPANQLRVGWNTSTTFEVIAPSWMKWKIVRMTGFSFTNGDHMGKEYKGNKFIGVRTPQYMPGMTQLVDMAIEFYFNDDLHYGYAYLQM